MSEQGDRLIGRTLGRFRIESLIGKGGLAAVYLATDLMWEMPAAVKVLPEFFADDEEHRLRFQREASTMANLTHPNIMPVRDYGQAEGVTFFAMDYAGGGTLEQRMGRPLTLEQALALLEPLAAAVSYAHSQGVVHRDLKPANILFDTAGRMLITDFGIAKLMEESGLTRTRESLGTPEYMAPEQSREASLVGKPADVYALGIILYELVTGQVPYQGNTVIDVIDRHKYAPIPSARAANPRLPSALDDFFRRVLAKDPGQRVQTVDEMQALLGLVSAGRALPPDPRAPAQADRFPPPASEPHITPVRPLTPGRRRRPPAWLWLVAILTLGGAAALAAFLLTRPKPERFYAAALRCQQRQEWSCCVDNLEQTLAIVADYRDAAGRLAECQCRQTAETAWREITRCQAAGDWDCIRQRAGQLVKELGCANDLAARKQYALAALNVAQAQAAGDPATAAASLQEVLDAGVKTEELPAGFAELFAALDAYLKGTAAFAAGNFEEVLTLLQPVGERWDASDYLYQSQVRICQTAVAEGALDTAEQAANKALDIQRDGPDASACLKALTARRVEALLAEAQKQLDAGQLEDAIAAANKILALQPDNSQAQALIREANRLLAENLDRQFQAKLQTGKDLLELCHLPEAMEAFNAALQLKPRDAEAQSGLQRAADLGEPELRRLTDSYDNWSGQQGGGGWYYLARTGSGDQPIGWAGGAYWWDRPEGTRIERDGQHPGRYVEAVRRWRSPISGQIVMDLQYKLADWRGNTTFYVQQGGQTIWRTAVSTTSFQQTRLAARPITAGTNLDFIVNSNNGPEADLTLLRATIYQQVPRCTRK
jgi:tetratricopeptide (TPR) repeat protein